MEISIKIQKIHSRVELPQYESEGAAGMDIRAFLDSDAVIPSLGRAKIPTGLRVQLPPGFEAQLRPRSGLAINFGLTLLNSPGTIDSDFRGNLEVILVNLSREEVIIKDRQRIAQLVIAPVYRAGIFHVDALDETSRGSGGFGSTGSI
ncbi:MAG: dUTP diphosphatase [Treponema sp.]|nr:dUTP diphosphatase [Treponema sp.]MCL2271347.1 dUTP diphosphatase [Treponema sp.]